jgi:hypothetical protein
MRKFAGMAAATASIAVLALSPAAPAVSHHGNHGHNGNHCGKGHQKHTHAVGKHCNKVSHHHN